MTPTRADVRKTQTHDMIIINQRQRRLFKPKVIENRAAIKANNCDEM